MEGDLVEGLNLRVWRWDIDIDELIGWVWVEGIWRWSFAGDENGRFYWWNGLDVEMIEHLVELVLDNS